MGEKFIEIIVDEDAFNKKREDEAIYWCKDYDLESKENGEGGYTDREKQIFNNAFKCGYWNGAYSTLRELGIEDVKNKYDQTFL